MKNAVENFNELYRDSESAQLMIVEYAKRLKKAENSNEFLLEDSVFSQQVKSSLHYQFAAKIYLQYILFYNQDMEQYDENIYRLFDKLEGLQRETLLTLQRVTEEMTKEN